MSRKLAIVIPAYKKAYFQESLDCLANQTCMDFCLYIGDDASPENLEEIVLPLSSKMPIKYHRFAAHIGAKHIVDQWKRCVELIRGEEWIWLFSDDDKVDRIAVEAFWKAVEETNGKYDIYSFNTSVIDKIGQIISPPPDIPICESSGEMAFHLLEGRRANCMADHIFSSAIYNKKNGFVKTVYGQGADWATSILFSGDNGIRFIQDALVYWRYSGDNISSVASKNKSVMIEGHFQFIRWILCHFKFLQGKESSQEEYLKIRNAAYKNLIRIINEHYQAVPISKLFAFVWLLRKYLKVSWVEVLSQVFMLNIVTRKYLKKAK
ncbi:MAG: glycosyltransferase family 2 protein [Bacteroidota bacterium]